MLVDTSASPPRVLFNSSDIDDTVEMPRPQRPLQMSPWLAFQEPVNGGAMRVYSPSGPPEQLNITMNDSDYCWSHTKIKQEKEKKTKRQRGWMKRNTGIEKEREIERGKIKGEKRMN